METQNDCGIDGQAVALISKIRHLSVYMILYGMVLIPILLLLEGDYPSLAILWAVCGILVLGGLWVYCFPFKTGLLACGIAHSLSVLYGVFSGLYVFGAGIVFAIACFMRFRDVRNTPVTREDLQHIKALKEQLSQKPGDRIRIVVITLVDKRVWKCAIRDDSLLICSQYRDELYLGRREDVRILGSNINKPRISVKFTLRMNGEIYRCKSSRLAYHKLAGWIEEGRWGIAR